MREMGETARKFTNVFVKNFGEEFDDESLHQVFEKFGHILSCTVMKGEEGKSKGFGFVAFEDPAEAETVSLKLKTSFPPCLSVRERRENE